MALVRIPAPRKPFHASTTHKKESPLPDRRIMAAPSDHGEVSRSWCRGEAFLREPRAGARAHHRRFPRSQLPGQTLIFQSEVGDLMKRVSVAAVLLITALTLVACASRSPSEDGWVTLID